MFERLTCALFGHAETYERGVMFRSSLRSSMYGTERVCERCGAVVEEGDVTVIEQDAPPRV